METAKPEDCVGYSVLVAHHNESRQKSLGKHPEASSIAPHGTENTHAIWACELIHSPVLECFRLTVCLYRNRIILKVIWSNATVSNTVSPMALLIFVRLIKCFENPTWIMNSKTKFKETKTQNLLKTLLCFNKPNFLPPMFWLSIATKRALAMSASCCKRLTRSDSSLSSRTRKTKRPSRSLQRRRASSKAGLATWSSTSKPAQRVGFGDVGFCAEMLREGGKKHGAWIMYITWDKIKTIRINKRGYK